MTHPNLVRPITRSDIKGPALYAPIRDDYRRRVIEWKRPRRILVGDRVSLVFENRHTLTLQIEEMCRAESLTADPQIEAEIEVYNALMPTATSLSATLFVELPADADPRVELGKLVGLDEHVALTIGDHALRAAFEPGRADADRISAVQYLRFPLTDAARAALAVPGTPVALTIDHPNYTHRTVAPDATRASLAQVHAARLPDGRAVAVKVQVPGIDEVVRADVAALSILAGALGDLVPGDLGAIAAELGRALTGELDYVAEGAAGAEVAPTLAGTALFVPAVIASHSTPRVLTTDRVDGRRLTEALAAASTRRP